MTENSSPRFRRLIADQKAIAAAFAGHPYITATPIGPTPASQYQVAYRVPVLRKNAANDLQEIGLTIVSIAIPAGYPREKPYCTTQEPIFHPNFGNYICIADFWSPSNTLVDVVIEIGQMLQYQLYNTRSPLNALAARWISENSNRIPVGELELLPKEPEIRLQ